MSSPAPRILTAAQARRIAIAAQGLAKALPLHTGPVNRGHLKKGIATLGLLQIDSVNVVARAHYLPLFARLGDYPVELLQDMIWPPTRRAGPRTLMEAWAHEASIVPVHTHRLLGWRREQYAEGRWAMPGLTERSPELLADVLAVITEHGPISAGGVAELMGQVRGPGGWWGWSDTKLACEKLFAVGRIGTAHRRSFERYYDLIERLLPADATEEPASEQAKKELVSIAAGCHGIGTVADLADYFRLPVADTKSALVELIEDGVVEQVQVRGWKEPAYLHAQARIPRSVDGAALLCPFDPLIWFRRRTERLFDFHYRIEIYTPQHKRIHGYYVFPLLVGDALVGRFDLKADRASGRLLVQASWLEPGAIAAQVIPRALRELHRMAMWLGLDGVHIKQVGDLAAPLADAAAVEPEFPDV